MISEKLQVSFAAYVVTYPFMSANHIANRNIISFRMQKFNLVKVVSALDQDIQREFTACVDQDCLLGQDDLLYGLQPFEPSDLIVEFVQV